MRSGASPATSTDGEAPRARGRAQREPKEVTRERIVEVALELIAERGFAATSTREISERLGFTKAALYYHFRTKDDLLSAIVGPSMHDLEALVANASVHGSSHARRRVVEAYVDLVAAHAELFRVVADDPSIRRSAVFDAAAPLYQRLTWLLAGTDRPGTARRARARAAVGAVHAALVRAQPDDDPALLRDEALRAACGALGLPPHSGTQARRPTPSRPRRHQPSP